MGFILQKEKWLITTYKFNEVMLEITTFPPKLNNLNFQRKSGK